MVKNPKDLLTKLTEEEKDQLKTAEKRIDNALERASLSNLSSGVYISTSIIPSGGRVYAKIKAMYENAGWLVDYFRDQRDGDAIVFKINKRLQDDDFDSIRPAYLR